MVRPKRHLFFLPWHYSRFGIVLLAFIPEYVGHQHRSLPVAWAVRIHAAIMTAWIVFFFVQAYLGATRRIAQHRRIGNGPPRTYNRLAILLGRRASS
jgi:hypothetical protein